MPNLWTLGGLSLFELLRRTARESWKDAVFGQGGRMAFYQFLAIFPSLLLFLAICARVPHFNDHMKNAIQNLSTQVMPSQVSFLFKEMLNELNQNALPGLQLISVFAAAAWAAHNGTWAMIYGLNRAYEVEEHRSKWELSVTVIGLTLALAIAGFFAIFVIFCGILLQANLHHSYLVLRIVEWVVMILLLSTSFSVLYRYGPNLRNHKWSWSTPGAICALVLWIACTFAARIYFDHFSNYARNYGHLSGVAMFLLWLYFTNGAVLIGGEMNSEIEKAAAEHGKTQDRSGS